VASRELERAKQFALNKELQDCNTYGRYEDIGDYPNVQVVYVGTITTTHSEIVCMLLKKSKLFFNILT